MATGGGSYPESRYPGRQEIEEDPWVALPAYLKKSICHELETRSV